MQQLPAADFNMQLLCYKHLVIRCYIKLKAEIHFGVAGFGGLGDLQLFQLLTAALRHFGSRSTHEVSGNIIFQLSCLCHIGIMLLLLQCNSHFFLRQIGRKIAFIGNQCSLLYLPDTVADTVEKIAVMADYQHSASVLF